MALNFLKRTTILPKFPAFSFISRITLSSIAESYCAHLLNHPQNPEKTLVRVGGKLDVPCVKQVLQRFSNEKPELGLRFFIWAGYQSKYRHSQYMYGLACDVFQIHRNLGRIREIIEVYRVEGCVISVKWFRVVLNLCRVAKIADEALWVLRKMEEFDCRPDSTMYNGVIELFCEKGDVDVASGLVKEMEERNLYPDMITFMSMLKAFCNAGRYVDAYGLVKTMKSHGCNPNLVAYSTLLDGLCRFGHFERALELLDEMEKAGEEHAPTVITYTSIIQRLCEKGKSSEALSILSRMEAFNCTPNRITISVLVKGLCIEGHIDEVHKLVERIGAEGHVLTGECYSFLLVGLLKMGRLQEAEKLFRWMLSSALRPDGLACSMLIKDMCAQDRVLDAFHVLEGVENRGFILTVDSDIYTVILRGLFQQMQLIEVSKLIGLMTKKGIRIEASHVGEILVHSLGTQEVESLVKLCKRGS